MRLEFRISQTNRAYIPFNRKYGLMTWIYSCLHGADERFAAELHAKKDIKNFVFSDLFIPYPYEVVPGRGVKKNSHRDLHLFFSSPDEVLVEKLLTGVVSSTGTSQFRLGPAEFSVNKVILNEQPKIRGEEILLPLSPVVTSTRRDDRIWFVGPDEEQFLPNIKRNLEKKYAKITDGSDIPPYTLEVATDYQRKGKVSFSLEFKKARITGYKIPFRLKGPAEITRVVYECGLGERNSQGFGMVELYRENDGAYEKKEEME